MTEKIKELFRNAVFRGDAESLESLTDQHPEIELDSIMYPATGNTLLHMAAQMGHTWIANFLLNHGMSPSIENIFGDTPLNVAATFGHGEIGSLLINAGGIYGNPAPAHNIVFNNEATGYWYPTDSDDAENHDDNQYHLQDTESSGLCHHYLVSAYC